MRRKIFILKLALSLKIGDTKVKLAFSKFGLIIVLEILGLTLDRINIFTELIS